ncbi:hypothetical protein G9A89_005998 [Geosiphon pyriformis]|nr:hypothetical protein G9A89_005998 [Geosiphon pyriformis]
MSTQSTALVVPGFSASFGQTFLSKGDVKKTLSLQEIKRNSIQQVNVKSLHRSSLSGGSVHSFEDYNMFIRPIIKDKSTGTDYLYIKALNGNILTLTVDLSNATVLQLKKAIEIEQNIPPNQQRLLNHGRELKDKQKLLDYWHH